MSDYHNHGHNPVSTRSSGYHSVFDRLSVTDTKSSARKRYSSPREKTPYQAFSGYRVASPTRSYGSQQPSIQPSTSSSSRLVSPRIFDRLASTETFASAQMKGKIAQLRRPKSASRPGRTSKSSNAFFDRMAYTETFASAQMKGLIDASSKKNNGGKSTSGRSGRSTRSKAMGSSFWDRMSTTETYASASMKRKYMANGKIAIPSASPRSYGTGRNSPSAKSSSSRSRKGYTTNGFFDRLSKTDTLSSLQNKKDQSAVDAAKQFHRSSPTYRQKKPMSVGGNNDLSYGIGSSSTSAYPRKYVSPSNRSVGSTRSRASVRSAVRSVATAKTATTARSLGMSTVRSNHTMQSNASSYSAQNALRTTNTATSRPSSATSRPSSASRRGLPPPSPKARHATTRRSTPPVRANSSSPRQMYGRRSPLPASSTSTLHRPRPQPARRTLAPKLKPVPKRKPVAVPKLKPVPKPTPAPRPILQFDDDDELSFGSEETDEASLGPASVKIPQDAGSVASKSITSKKELSTAADSNGVAAAASGVAGVTALSAAMASASVFEEEEEEIVPSEEEEETEEGLEEPASSGVEEDVLEETEDFLDELDQQSEGASQQLESEYGHSKEQDVNTVGEEHIDDFLDDLEDENEPESREKPEEEEEHNQAVETKGKEEEEPRVPLVHESDDELSFGSDEENDDWLGDGSQKKEAEAAADEAKLPIKDADEKNKKGSLVDTVDDLDDVLDSSSESQEDIIYENRADDASMEDDEESVESENNFESKVGEEEMAEEQDREQQMGSKSEADDVDYDTNDGVEEGDEVIDYEPQIVEEEYNEQEDLEHMDSLDLVLDATQTGDDHQEEIVDGEDEFDAKMADHTSNKFKIKKSEKYHPEYGLEDVHPDDLYLKETLQCFEDGDITNEEISVLIIEALFEKDFENGDHWELDAGTARELEEDEGGGGDLDGCAFVVKRQARLDWNDLYSVAAAKGTIIIDLEKNEIRVENYSYFVAG